MLPPLIGQFYNVDRQYVSDQSSRWARKWCSQPLLEEEWEQMEYEYEIAKIYDAISNEYSNFLFRCDIAYLYTLHWYYYYEYILGYVN